MSAELAELVRALGSPPMPAAVWQAQFDGDDAALKRLAYARPGETVRAPDLMSYCDDLRYVEELQEGLLLRVLPHLLHAWRALLLKGGGAGGFSENFQAALAQRREFVARVLGPDGTRACARYMAATLLELMSREDSLSHRGGGATPYAWGAEFVSFGCAWDEAELVLEPWRRMQRPGLAVCAVQYLSSLVYDGADSPVFERWTKDEGGGPLWPWQRASGGFEERWSGAAAEALRARLAGGKAAEWLREAAAALKGHAHGDRAARVAADAAARSARVEARVEELCRLLATPSDENARRWSS